MTKAEERKALDRIRKIVAEAGADSYIATALDGALDLAESNITEDAAHSCRWYMNKYYDHEREAREQRENAAAELQDAKAEADAWREAAGELKDKWRAAIAEAEKARADKNKAVVRQAELEQEVMKLKAMLFDYMVAERK